MNFSKGYLPNYNTNLEHKYKVGDIIKNRENQLFFVARTSGHMYYTIIRLHDKYRMELLKGQINAQTVLTLSSALKDL